MNPQLQLRDIHLPPEPSWWPPAPGWWLLAVLLLVSAVILTRWVWRRVRARRRLARLMAEFDAVAGLGDPGARLVAISQLLRRAARLRDPRAANLQGEDWLRFLDQVDDGQPPTTDSWRILLNGPYQPQIDPAAVDALLEVARARFQDLVTSP
jgi:hypothetical protein